MTTNTRHIYTDGAAPNNQNGCVLGGIGVVVLDDKGEVELTKSIPVEPPQGCSYTTNSRCELQAFIEGLKVANAGDTLYSDSRYVVNGYNEWLEKWVANGWRRSNKKRVESVDLWMEIKQMKRSLESVKVVWVKGHSEDMGNQLADNLARLAVDSIP